MTWLYHKPCMPKFTEAEEKFIRERFLTHTYEELAAVVGRSMKCVSEKVRRMGLDKLSVIMSRKKNKSYRAYVSWAGMMTRCTNPNSEPWPIYGGRGIKVCEKWRTFEGFLSDMGEKPAGYSIDRIDPNGNYEPGNCRWIPRNDQARTTRAYYATKPCIDCKKNRGSHGGGRCHRCAEYFKRRGKPRPPMDGVVPMAPRPTKICTNCKRESRPVCHNRCMSCAEYFRRKGTERPERLWFNSVALKPSHSKHT